MTGLQVSSLQADLPFGARISGVTRESLADAGVRRQINEVFEDRGVILFEDVEPSGAMQVLISEVIGPLKDHPVKTVERVDQNKMPGVITIRTDPTSTIVEIDGKPLLTWQPWHFDHAYNNELNRAGVLRAETIATEGGLTAFSDGIQIYRDMSPEIRAKIEGKNIIYDLDLRYSRQSFGLPPNFRVVQDAPGSEEMVKLFPRSIHPAVWTRETGEKVMHMCPYGTRGIEGMVWEDALPLMQQVWPEIERSMKIYTHQWRPGDMLLWDNWRVLHEALGCDPKYDRVMHRTTIKGDYGLGRWETEPEAAVTEASRY